MSELMDSKFESASSKERSCPGDTFNTDTLVEEKGAVAPCTLVAICDCSVFFLPSEVLASLPKPHVDHLQSHSRSCSKRSSSKQKYSIAVRNSLLSSAAA